MGARDARTARFMRAWSSGTLDQLWAPPAESKAAQYGSRSAPRTTSMPPKEVPPPAMRDGGTKGAGRGEGGELVVEVVGLEEAHEGRGGGAHAAGGLRGVDRVHHVGASRRA